MTANRIAADHRPYRRFAQLRAELRNPVVGRRVPGTVLVALFAGLLSLAASAYFVPSGLSLAYGDALAHLTIARRLFDTMSDPGFGQLGTVWLPMPHLLLAPFVAVIGLWRTGWGGALLGACCLAATAAGGYRAAARWNYGRLARLAVVGVLVLNPSMLYLYSTALTEPVLIAGVAGCLAGLSHWATKTRRLSPGELAIFAGLPATVAVLSRYEGWALVAAGALFVGIMSWRREGPRPRIIGRNMFGFLAVPLLAMAWWVAFNWVTFSDPFAFIFGPYSASALQADLVAQGLTTIHDLPGSFATLNLAVVSTVGVGALGLGALGLVIGLIAWRTTNRLVFLAMTTITYVFMLVSLYAGQAVIFNPASSATAVWNNRYGMASILPVALAVGFGVQGLSEGVGRQRLALRRLGRVAIPVVVVGALLWSSIWQAQAPAERSLVLNEAQAQLAGSVGPRAAAAWLGANYDGGRILLDEGVAANSILPLAGIPLREYYLRAGDRLFDAALDDPVGHARWLWASTQPGDGVSERIAELPGFTDAYELAHAGEGVRIYRRR